MRLKSAAEQLLRLRTKPHQCPRCDNAIFLLLLHTGLRVSELAALNRHQYRGEHLLDVKRKGKMRTAKIFLPREAKAKRARAQEAKRRHLDLFTAYFQEHVGSD